MTGLLLVNLGITNKNSRENSKVTLGHEKDQCIEPEEVARQQFWYRI
jgi:hypothetical protein